MGPVSTCGRKWRGALRGVTRLAAACVLLTGQLGPVYAAIDNDAVATGTYAGTGPAVSVISVPSSQSVTVAAPNAALVVHKSAGTIVDTNGSGVTDAGDTITWTFSVSNTGNVTLAGVQIADPSATVSGGPIASLVPGATDTSTFTAARLLTQADIDAGGVENSATATASSPGASGDVTDVKQPKRRIFPVPPMETRPTTRR